MFLNLTNISGMETMAALAEGFFNAKCPKYSDNNYEKCVLVNSKTNKCSFQRKDYPMNFGETIFKCVRKDGHTEVSVLYYLPEEGKAKRTVTNLDGEYITRIDGNSKDADTGFSGEYVKVSFELDLDVVIRGRITNINELIDTGFYNEETVRDAYQAIGDFAEVINDAQEDCYPVYVRTPFCEDCSYLFQYQCFSFINDKKVCINYTFLGIISDNVTKEDIEEGRSVKVKGGMCSADYSIFLQPYEVHLLTDALYTALEEFNRVFSWEDCEKYEVKKSLIMNRFYPKLVVKTKYGIFYVIYDRPSDYALIDYLHDASTSMERILQYGDFGGASELIKKKLEELSQKE